MDYRIEQLRYLLREDPSSRNFYQLGELLRREGDAGGAVEVLTTGLERHPRYVAAWVSLGRSQRELGDLEEATEAFQTALAIDRENPVAARLLGDTAVERGDWIAAVKALKLARALSGRDDELDARIALVEEHLAEDGRLEPPPPSTRVSRPARSLEVVSLSADDPFATTAEAAGSVEAVSDVFEIVETPAETGAAETASAEEPAAAEPAPDDGRPLSDEAAGADVESAAAAEVVPAAEAVPVAEADARQADAETVSEAFAEAEAGPEVPAVDVDDVDESSVGAWSAATAVAAVADGWTEPADEIVMDEDRAAASGPWTEPSPAIDDRVGPEVESVEQAAAEPESTDLRQAAVDDFSPPVEVHHFDSMEVTHPDVAEQRRLEAEALAMAEVDEPVAAGDEVIEDAAARAAADPAGRRHELDHGLPLPTMTLAKLALDQDDRPLARATLESLIERDPGNTEAVELLDRLSREDEMAEAEQLRAARATTKIAALQGWLDAVRLAAERRAQ